MSLAEKIQEVDSLQSKIEGFGKLPDAVLKKINYKFRLEWNYTSNSMEGNTLTLEETRSVMVGNITVEGKPLKDVLEMKGHDDIITNILKIGKKELNISENKIKDIHKGIMYEDDPAKQEKIGKWKTQPNYILNYKGERNDFTAPEEVSDEMHKLVNWLNTEKEKHDRATKEAMHPALIAFKFHLDYISIHPFYDGNGRTARILMNLILISYGYPPVYIKANEKTPYYQYLADIQGYGGEPDLFYEYMLGLLMRSQQLVLNAIEGKEIEEADDVYKDLELLRRMVGDNAIVTKNPNLVYKIYQQTEKEINPLIQSTLAKFDKFFGDKKQFRYINGVNETYKKETVNKLFPIVFTETREVGKVQIWGWDIYEEMYEVDELLWRTKLYGLKNVLSQTDVEIDLKLRFFPQEYLVDLSVDNKVIFSINYSYSNEINDVLALTLEQALAKYLLKKIKSLLTND